MGFEKQVPAWNAPGVEPPDSLKNADFQAGYKPPADYFNWFMYGVSNALTELQSASARDFKALSEQAVYYSSVTEVDIDTATQSLLLVDKKWSKDCPLCKDSGFVFIMQLFFGDPSASTNRTQIAFSYGDGGANAAKGVALRCYFNGAWSGWTELYGPHNASNIPLNNFAGQLSTAKGGTGASTTEAGFKTLATRATVNGTNLVNANTLTASGIHMVYLDSGLVPDPKTLNFPYYYGVLAVAESNAYVAQTFYSVSADTVFYRTSYDGGAKWGDWKTVYTDKNLTVAAIGAASADHNHDGRYYRATDVERGANMVLAAPDNTNGDAVFRKLVANDLPVVPIAKGGTGTTGWHQALTNLRAMERQAVYYSTTLAPDIDTLTDSLMLIPYEYSKGCPVGGGFVYIMQLFYGDITASSNRTQVAFPYLVEGNIGKGIAIRAYQNGTWTEWQNVLEADTVDGYHVQKTPGNIGLKPIYASDYDLTAGTSALETGTLYFVYE